MSEETIKNIAWVVVLMFGIQSFSLYALVRLMITGRAMFERKERDRDHERPSREIGLDGR
jgi:hypothetical protein